MRNLVGIAVFVAALAWAGISSATILNQDCWPGLNGAFGNVSWGWDAGSNTMNTSSTQYFAGGVSRARLPPAEGTILP